MARFVTPQTVAELMGMKQPVTESDGTPLCPTHYRQLHRMLHSHDHVTTREIALFGTAHSKKGMFSTAQIPKLLKNTIIQVHNLEFPCGKTVWYAGRVTCSAGNCKKTQAHQL